MIGWTETGPHLRLYWTLTLAPHPTTWTLKQGLTKCVEMSSKQLYSNQNVSTQPQKHMNTQTVEPDDPNLQIQISPIDPGQMMVLDMKTSGHICKIPGTFIIKCLWPLTPKCPWHEMKSFFHGRTSDIQKQQISEFTCGVFRELNQQTARLRM